MKRVLRWAGYGLAGLAGVVAVSVGGAFAASEFMIRRPASAPFVKVAAAADPGAVARGRRLATLEGCVDCHGARLEGRLFHDEPALIRAFAPNLTLAAQRQSDAELERAIRQGVAADGRRLWIMPSSAFSRLTDAETADLIAFLRSQPPVGAPQPRLQVGPVGRIGILLGRFQSEPDLLKTAAARRPLPDLGAEHAKGRALVRACVECHGSQLEGNPAMNAPDLMVAGAYSTAEFATLLRTGVATGGRRVGLMSQIAPERFHGLSDAEVSAVHGYLKARAGRRLAAAETRGLPNP